MADGDRSAPVPAHSSASLARARAIARVLDTAIHIPGTKIRIGLDPILGLIPGIGDFAGAAASAYLIFVAARAGASPAVLAKMLGNIGLDALFGVVPVLGDLFDAAYKSNTRNLRLLESVAGTGESVGVKRGAGNLALVVVVIALLITIGAVTLGVLLARALMREAS